MISFKFNFHILYLVSENTDAKRMAYPFSVLLLKKLISVDCNKITKIHDDVVGRSVNQKQ